jgi:deoxyribodipyrimidine photo-lyase
VRLSCAAARADDPGRSGSHQLAAAVRKRGLHARRADPTWRDVPMTLGTDQPVIFWFRQDLRIADNPSLAAAVDTGQPVVPVYILDDEMASRRRLGGASRWWLHHSLASLGDELSALAGGTIERPALILRRGSAETVLRSLIAETEATAVFWTRCYEPEAITRDNHIKQAHARDGIEARNFDLSLMFEPWTIATAQGSPYRVFTPYYRACMARSPPPLLPSPLHLRTTAVPLPSEQLEDLDLLPIPDWAGGLRSATRRSRRRSTPQGFSGGNARNLQAEPRPSRPKGNLATVAVSAP